MTAPTKQLLSLRFTLCLLIAGIVGVCLGVGAFRLTGRVNPPSGLEATATSGLTVAAEHLNFGDQWENPNFEWVLPIENRQDHEARIEGFSKSCTCLKTEPSELVIPAGQTREVRLNLDLTARERKSLPPPVRDFSVSITPRIHAPKKKLPRIDWKVHGRVRTAISFDKPTVDFGRCSEATHLLPVQKVLVTSVVPLQDLTAVSKSDALRVQVTRMTDDTQRFELAISALKLPIGPIKSEISVEPLLSDGQPLPKMLLPVNGSVVSDFQASPP